ncbi:hypothetical protein [Colwellia psychrerythraea]|uniref:Uncharacterized protein n=1 Tax=Colwellia psychrerythraea TaxID=28229 RepID=A0A099L6H8_COLPS|nr:hypothetical protein [Colwellia psychrerythraea]KGJ97488.1 hypothetical protein GAB14E_1077 [Colwellia psychrerythraea]
MSAELSILLLNAVIIIVAYLSIYPKLAGNNLNKVAMFDCLASGVALIIVASKYWETGIIFDFLMFELNWFWFTLLSYGVLEIPVALWYFRLEITQFYKNK